MSTSRHIDKICALGLGLALLATALFLNGGALGVQPSSRTMGYEARLFDARRVHTLDIVMDGWEDFLDACENEEYSPCAVVIDGEAVKNVGIRAKGNTSLSMVSAMDSSRYSFKLEFDHYEAGNTYYGLDKLCLNNIIQDNTYMKDYLAYRMMDAFGVAAPLCSYIFITVNGQDWGLYLAVEGIEDSFLQRSYGTQHGQLYKPDSTGFGGGRGNGKAFDMEGFDFSAMEEFAPPEMPDGAPMEGRAPDLPNPRGREGSGGRGGPPAGGGPGGGMGSDDVKLKYIDSDPDSYPNIFDNAKTDASKTDKERLIRSLKALSSGGVEQSVDIDAVLRYFVVHNFVVNGDSYTGSMVHNYYLYEKDGLLSMIPWDYNLAFGTFQGNDASSAVNDSINTPLSVSGDGDRPMADWICSSGEYTALYHQYFAEFLDTVDPAALIEEARSLIAPYVERDPTRFCTYEEFEAGAAALEAFCALRAESASNQLDGSDALVDAAGLDLSAMGTMNMGGGFGRGRPEMPQGFPQKSGSFEP